MKNLITLFCFILLVSSNSLSALAHNDDSNVPTNVSETSKDNITEVIPSDYKKRSPIYDYSEQHLNNIDSIPGFDTKRRCHPFH